MDTGQVRQIGVGYFKSTPRMREYVNDVLDTGRLSYGPYCREFEVQLATLHDCDYGVLSNSGTSSLQIAIQTLKEIHGWEDGDEILVPSVTFVATVNTVLWNRLRPVLVDVDPLYWEINPDLIERVITDRTRAIIPVHLFGQPCDMGTITAIAHKHHLLVVEDSCECMFAQTRDVSVGAWGDIGVFSTYVAHILTTGVGGIATTNDREYAIRMRSLVNHGRDGIYISIDDDDQPTQEIVSKRFQFDHIGHSYRMTELEAALGLAQLDGWRDIVRVRRNNAGALMSNLFPVHEHVQCLGVRSIGTWVPMMFPLATLQEPKTGLVMYLEQHGIETRDALPLVNQPCYAGLWEPGDYPVAQWLDEHAFYVGCHPGLTADDLQYMTDAIHVYFSHGR